jgi:hypothetical protein
MWDQRSGGSLPSLKPGEILGAGALADRVRLLALAGGSAFGSGAGFGAFKGAFCAFDFRSAPRPPACPAPRGADRGAGRGDNGRRIRFHLPADQLREPRISAAIYGRLRSAISTGVNADAVLPANASRSRASQNYSGGLLCIRRITESFHGRFSAAGGRFFPRSSLNKGQ